MPSFKEFLYILFTFILVTIAWVFFRSNTCYDALAYLNNMLHIKEFSVLGKKDALALVIVLLIFDWLGRHQDNTLDAIIQRFPKWRYLIYLLLGVFILANFSKQASFIYFQF